MTKQQRSELPLPDYDHLPTGSLEHRIRSLAAGELEELLRYEREHADRRPVTELLTTRLGQLASGGRPSGGGRGGFRPEQPGPPRGGSPVSPDTSPEPISPPPHGTPDQRGKPKADRP
ncbi:hypothetical protein RKE29_09370 [Streptomyces sp. B1866]|uniref:hypothetical protein n=1 Tax=Streptomyces sp. B1866 TaxID=3075431 RepID=UPI0028909983|nr:hypothetical protein [Streptomyces sp. B1866]MDT3396850.1 hypothetical protein [Streptomyces sp. B1866]